MPFLRNISQFLLRPCDAHIFAFDVSHQTHFQRVKFIATFRRIMAKLCAYASRNQT